MPPKPSPRISLKPTVAITADVHAKRCEREEIPSDLKGTYSCGVYQWDIPIGAQAVSRLRILEQYFTSELLDHVVVPIISGVARISLRLLHYFVITYSKLHMVSGSHGQVYTNYRTWLHHYKREYYDSFRRGPRIYFKHQGYMYSTTVAQLNFLYWALNYGVIEYLVQHCAAVEQDMNRRLSQVAKLKAERKKLGLKRKRIRISVDPPIKCFVSKNTTSVRYVTKGYTRPRGPVPTVPRQRNTE